ncbi:conjugative transposon protein TraN [Dyadobacter sp. CY312]|uniref:conjugative transposon protein TraN n=1 Tax=Dyadobacter sp. CY312 TaxID=2907303 RepID=UPI001F3DC190|nr:conjugative transposon protein TraN [Dyadobacter sp. CY312]MCE7044074.1 conjugative transposon protein TraN [Dyadobacter sp. CY312]
MKPGITWVFHLLMLLRAAKAFSQNSDTQLFVHQPYPLELTTTKTTHLVFPYDIISIDRGSRAILAQKAKGTGNILQVKAAQTDFDQSSLTVITADKKLYSFTVDYAAEPLQLTIEFSGGRVSAGATLEESHYDQAELRELSKKVISRPKRMRGEKDRSFQSSFSLDGIYIQGDVIYFQLRVTNRSAVNYDIGSLRFFIRDKKRVKRTAVQEQEIKPLYIHADSSVIAAKSARNFVYALPKFTTADKKGLAVELMEKNGGRHMQLGISNRAIVRARPVTD